jgi:hypothetical protein
MVMVSSLSREPVFTMSVSVWVDGYGLVTRCEPCVTNDM